MIRYAYHHASMSIVNKSLFDVTLEVLRKGNVYHNKYTNTDAMVKDVSDIILGWLDNEITEDVMGDIKVWWDENADEEEGDIDAEAVREYVTEVMSDKFNDLSVDIYNISYIGKWDEDVSSDINEILSKYIAEHIMKNME